MNVIRFISHHITLLIPPQPKLGMTDNPIEATTPGQIARCSIITLCPSSSSFLIGFPSSSPHLVCPIMVALRTHPHQIYNSANNLRQSTGDKSRTASFRLSCSSERKEKILQGFEHEAGINLREQQSFSVLLLILAQKFDTPAEIGVALCAHGARPSSHHKRLKGTIRIIRELGAVRLDREG